MAQITTKPTARKTAPVTHGKARLTHSDLASLDECLDAGAVILFLMPDNGSWRDYFVRSIKNERGKVIGYRLETLVGSVEDAAPVYEVDCSFGGINDYMACDCPDWTWRRRNTGCNCKHILGLKAAMQAPNQTVEF